MNTKTLASALALSLSAVMTSCGSLGSSLGQGSSMPGTVNSGGSLGGSLGSAAGDILGGLLGTLIGNNLPVTEASLQGTWVYNKPEVRFESEGFLSQAGGMVAASTIEQKLADYYGAVGIKPGNAGFVFGADKSCSIVIGGKSIAGRYTINSNNNEIKFQSNTGLIKLTGKVYFGVNSLVVLFDADKLLSVIQGIGAFTGNLGSSLSSISSFLGQYKGMLVGMELGRQ